LGVTPISAEEWLFVAEEINYQVTIVDDLWIVVKDIEQHNQKQPLQTSTMERIG
jgi:hypothetical protein